MGLQGPTSGKTADSHHQGGLCSIVRAERLLDANLNRAREGLRTLEELARLILEDTDLAESFRTRRRRLGELGEAQLPDLLPQRSAATDPGMAPEVAAGLRRDLSDVAAAAAGRVGESLRVLEEVGATVSPAFSTGIQAIRHGWYDLDRDLRLRLGARKPLIQPRLCVLLTRELCPEGDWTRVVDALAEGGVDMVQIREKSCSDGELLRHAEVVRSKLPSSTRLVINDRVAVAATLGLDVHLGREDLPTLAARHLLGRDVQIGRSTSGLAEAQQALAEGADLVGVGPMFVSATKDKPPVGPAAAGTVASAGIPHLAIGGVDLQNIDVLCEHGVAGVAICRGVLEASDVAGTVHAIQSRFGLVAEGPSCL